MFRFWNNNNELSVKLTPDAFVDAIKRGDTKMIEALVHNKSNDLTFDEMKLLSTAITVNKKDIVTILMNDNRVNPAKYNDMFFGLVINKSDTFYVKNILRSIKVMPSYGKNILFKHYLSRGDHDVLVLIINHPNFVASESINDSVDYVRAEEEKKEEEARKDEEKKKEEEAKNEEEAKKAEVAKAEEEEEESKKEEK